MNEKTKNILLFLFSITASLMIYLLIDKYYDNSSFENYKYCVNLMRKSSLSTDVCSDMLRQSNIAYGLLGILTVTALTLILYSFGTALLRLSKESKEAREKPNV